MFKDFKLNFLKSITPKEKLETAKTAIFFGWVLALVTATSSSPHLKTVNSPRVLIFTIAMCSLIFVLAFGIYKNSRVASIIFLLLFVGFRFFEALEKNLSDIFWISSAIGIIFAAMAVWGTFVWHEMNSKQKLEK